MPSTTGNPIDVMEIGNMKMDIFLKPGGLAQCRVIVVVVGAHVQKVCQGKKGSKPYSRLHLTMQITPQVICLIGDKIVVREVDHQRHKIGPTSKDWRRTESLEFKVDYVQVCIHTTFIHFEKRMEMFEQEQRDSNNISTALLLVIMCSPNPCLLSPLGILTPYVVVLRRDESLK